MAFKVLYLEDALTDLEEIFDRSREKHPATTEQFADALFYRLERGRPHSQSNYSGVRAGGKHSCIGKVLIKRYYDGLVFLSPVEGCFVRCAESDMAAARPVRFRGRYPITAGAG